MKKRIFNIPKHVITVMETRTLPMPRSDREGVGKHAMPLTKEQNLVRKDTSFLSRLFLKLSSLIRD